MARRTDDGRKRRFFSGRFSGRPVTDDVLALLREAGLPNEVDRDLTVDELARTDAAAEQALARILASPRDPEPGAAPVPATPAAGRRSSSWSGPRWLRPSRLTLATVVGGLVVAGVVVVVQPSHDQSTPGQATPSQPPPSQSVLVTPPMSDFSLVSSHGNLKGGKPAGKVLERLARISAAQPPAAGSGPVQHIVTDAWYFHPDRQGGGSLVPVVVNGYFLPDGNFRSIETVGEPLGPDGRVSTERPPTTTRRSDETFRGSPMGPGYASTLPTTPKALLTRLLPDRSSCLGFTACIVRQFRTLHDSWVVPPKVTGAFWAALADRPDVRYLGTSVDRIGRPALAFATPSSGANFTEVLFADAATGKLLGSESILIRRTPGDELPDSLVPPAVYSFSALVSADRIPRSQLP